MRSPRLRVHHVLLYHAAEYIPNASFASGVSGRCQSPAPDWTAQYNGRDLVDDLRDYDDAPVQLCEPRIRYFKYYWCNSLIYLSSIQRTRVWRTYVSGAAAISGQLCAIWCRSTPVHASPTRRFCREWSRDVLTYLYRVTHYVCSFRLGCSSRSVSVSMTSAFVPYISELMPGSQFVYAGAPRASMSYHHSTDTSSPPARRWKRTKRPCKSSACLFELI